MNSTKNNFYLVSYPKSGRTWLAMMLSDFDIYPILDHYTWKLAVNTNAERKFEFFLGEEHYKQLTFESYKSNEKVLFLMRDPRDVVVSMYHHLVDRYKRDHLKDFKKFIRSEKTGLIKIIYYQLKIFQHTKNAEHPFLIIRYEEMIRNSYQTMRHILNFYGKFSHRKEDIERVIEHRSFENMKRLEVEGGYEKNGLIYLTDTRDLNNKNTFKVRNGKIGSYKHYFDDEDYDYFDSLIQKTKYPKTFLVD